MVTEQALDEKTYRAIGRFVFEFSQVEFTIRYILGLELKLPAEHFSSVLGTYDVMMLTTVAIEVLKKTHNKAAEIEKLLNRFRAINEDRKRVAHGLWVPSADGGGAVHYVSRNKLTATVSIDQANELERKTDELLQLRSELMAVGMRKCTFDLDTDTEGQG